MTDDGMMTVYMMTVMRLDDGRQMSLEYWWLDGDYVGVTLG